MHNETNFNVILEYHINDDNNDNDVINKKIINTAYYSKYMNKCKKDENKLC